MSMKSFVVDPVPGERPCKASSGALLTLASLEGRLPGRLDGRPRRTKVIPFNLRKRFMEVLDDDGTSKILVYITAEGTVRRDVSEVQDELEAAGEFRGMKDKWEVDIGEMMDENIEVKACKRRASSKATVGKKRARVDSDEDDDDTDDQFDEDEEESEEEEEDSDDREAVEDDEEESDRDFEPEDEEDAEETTEVDEEYEEDEPVDLEEELKDLKD